MMVRALKKKGAPTTPASPWHSTLLYFFVSGMGNPNMNNKDHIGGQLTSIALSSNKVAFKFFIEVDFNFS